MPAVTNASERLQPDAPAPGDRSADEHGGIAPDVLAAAARGDEDAWREIVRAYGRRIYALAKSRLRDPELAEEVTQSVFATVAGKLGGAGYEERGRFEAWLFRVAMNRVRDAVRRARREHRGVEDAASLAAGAVEDRAERIELDRLRGALAMLGEADREVIELRHHGQMGFREMAELLGAPVGTLLARHHRALRKLREMMESDEMHGGAA
jgi:RNA polymerase sigma-70 factor (ECF subfamily)